MGGALFGTLTILETTIDGVGRALGLSSGTLDVTLDRLASSGSTSTGITLGAVGGTLTVNSVGGTSSISGADTGAISISSGNVSLTYNGNINQSDNAPLLSVNGAQRTLTFQNGTLSASSGPACSSTTPTAPTTSTRRRDRRR